MLRWPIGTRQTGSRPTDTPGVGWVVQSVTNAAGQQVHADGTLTAIYTPHVTYFASSRTGVRRIYTRTAWADRYAQINENITFVQDSTPLVCADLHGAYANQRGGALSRQRQPGA